MRGMTTLAGMTLVIWSIGASGAALAAGPMGRSADGLSCAVTVPAKATPGARCAAIKRQCGGKFYANACGDRMLSAAK